MPSSCFVNSLGESLQPLIVLYWSTSVCIMITRQRSQQSVWFICLLRSKQNSQFKVIDKILVSQLNWECHVHGRRSKVSSGVRPSNPTTTLESLGLELKVNVGDIFKRWTWRPVDGKWMMGHSDLNRHSLSSAGSVGLFLKAHLTWWRRLAHFFLGLACRTDSFLLVSFAREQSGPEPLPWTVNIYSPPRETTVGYRYRGTPCGWIWVGGGIKW